MSLSLWLFGLVLGMRHALEPDHLAAVSTLVAERRTGSGAGAVLGGIWGLGHTLALLAVAVLLGWAGTAMPPRLALAFELAVAFMLIAIHWGRAIPITGGSPAGRWSSAWCMGWQAAAP
jgi:high-affinity nickel permease